MNKNLVLFSFWVGLLMMSVLACTPKSRYSLDQHPIHPQADSLYLVAAGISSRTMHVDSAKLCVALLDQAIALDSLNPDYHTFKARLTVEMGELDQGLAIQQHGIDIGAVSPMALLQLGMLQAAKDSITQAKQTFKSCEDYSTAVLERYPDSLGAYFAQQCALSLYHDADSLFMQDSDKHRKIFESRQAELVMLRYTKPSTFVTAIKEVVAIADSLKVLKDSVK